MGTRRIKGRLRVMTLGRAAWNESQHPAERARARKAKRATRPPPADAREGTEAQDRDS